MPPLVPLSVIRGPSQGFLISRGCESWNPGWPAIDLCHCVHLQPLQRSPCMSPLLCIHLLLPLLCISCTTFLFSFQICCQKPLWFLPTTTKTSFRCEICKNSWAQCSESIPVLCWAVGNCQEITPVKLEGHGGGGKTCSTFVKLSVKIVSQVKGKVSSATQNNQRI